MCAHLSVFSGSVSCQGNWAPKSSPSYPSAAAGAEGVAAAGAEAVAGAEAAAEGASGEAQSRAAGAAEVGAGAGSRAGAGGVAPEGGADRADQFSGPEQCSLIYLECKTHEVDYGGISALSLSESMEQRGVCTR